MKLLDFSGSGKLFFNIFLKLEDQNIKQKAFLSFFTHQRLHPRNIKGNEKHDENKDDVQKGQDSTFRFSSLFSCFLSIFSCASASLPSFPVPLSMKSKTYYLVVAANKPVIGRSFLLVRARRSCDIETFQQVLSDNILLTSLLLGGITVIQFRAIFR